MSQAPKIDLTGEIPQKKKKNHWKAFIVATSLAPAQWLEAGPNSSLCISTHIRKEKKIKETKKKKQMEFTNDILAIKFAILSLGIRLTKTVPLSPFHELPECKKRGGG